MATVKLRGTVEGKRVFPGRDGKEDNCNVTVQDGERFGVFVPVSHPLASCEVGDLVEVEGLLQVRKSGQYTNLNVSQIGLFRRGSISWGGGSAKPAA